MSEPFFTLISRLFRGLFRPSSEVARLIELAHRGEISIEELTSATVSRGRLKTVVNAVAQILMDLKQQRAEQAALEQEMRDRIANRTDALERKIGSLQVQATRDGLTGLGNRRGLDAALPKLIEHYKSVNVDSAVLMIDVDHFKPLNDTLGHAAGDQLLRELGQLIRSTLRGHDQAFRSGGDEFVILLHACDLTAAQAIGKRLESLVRRLTQPLKVLHPPQLSIGACALSELDSPTPETFLHTADTRLYEVKSQRPRTRRSA